MFFKHFTSKNQLPVLSVSGTLVETVEMENNINALNEPIRLKEAPMQVSQTRLDCFPPTAEVKGRMSI